MRRRWGDIVTKLGGDDQAQKSMGQLFSGLAGQFYTSASLTQVRIWIAAETNSMANMYRMQSERARQHHDFVGRCAATG